jgi:hypothetical protein
MDTNTLTLTEQEKKYLENYKEENPFLKSLSDFYKERAMLSEKQILALRKESDNHKKKLSHCTTTGLMLKEICKFYDKEYKEEKLVVINSVREKAICISDEENNVYAWMPSSAIDKVIDFNAETGDEMSIITLKSWFTRDDDFWKQSKPFVPNETKESQIQDATELIEDVMQESKIEFLEIGDPRIPTPNIEENSEENSEEKSEEELPF